MLILTENTLLTLFGKIVKRSLDIVLSLLGLLLASPILIATATIVRLKIGSPILFKQERPGHNSQVFCLYKFRTMTEGKDANGALLPDDIRLTPVGRMLRRYSLDELPQLLNVLKGDMSLVGPRPLLVEYLPLYSTEQKRRHEVQPGITGWAQVNGRNALSWPERFKLDTWYVDHQTLLLDLKILWMTLAKVFLGDGISEKGRATMSKFTGNEKSEIDSP